MCARLRGGLVYHVIKMNIKLQTVCPSAHARIQHMHMYEHVHTHNMYAITVRTQTGLMCCAIKMNIKLFC